MDVWVKWYVGIFLFLVIVALLPACASTQTDMFRKQEEPDIRPAPDHYEVLFQRVRERTLAQHGSEAARLYINYSSSSVNAVTWDDGSIVLFKGLLRYVTSDDELVGIIGHEYCHILNGDLGAGRNISSKQQEYEADVCGLQLAVKAGYSCLKVAKIWLRYHKDHPKFRSQSHPLPLDRYNRLMQECP